MKWLWGVLAGCLLSGWTQAQVLIEQVDLTGAISESGLALSMKFEADVERAPARLKVLDGTVAPTDFSLPRGAKMVRDGDAYYIEFRRKGGGEVSVDFAAKVFSEGQVRGVAFDVPDAAIRKITLETGSEGRNVDIKGAPRVQKLDATRVQTFLPSSGVIQMTWSPELEKLSGELVASCDSLLIGSAKVGALQVQAQFIYTISQGRMKSCSVQLPDGLNVIQVSGEDLLAWDVRDGMLSVELSRPWEEAYTLTVQAEQTLPEFPCSFEFPVLEPQDVIRASGVALVGTDSTIKLLVDDLGGLTQVEPKAVQWGTLTAPKRGLYAYMFANMPFRMKLSADNIVTSLHAQDQLVLSLSESDAALEAAVDLEVRDAPAREVEFKVSEGWTVAGVSGRNVSDYDVRDRDGARWIKVYFKQEVSGRALIQLRLEKTLSADAAAFRMPEFELAGARSERGFLVLSGETGTRLEGVDLSGLREVNTGSLPVRVADARQAFRFKRPDWSGQVTIRQEASSIHAESFQLVSLGESGVFGSSLFTYNIANAPVRRLELHIPSGYRNVEIHGRDIRNWTQDGERWIIHLQQKVIGDYTLLVTYDHAAQYQGEPMEVGGVYSLDVENETGYIAMAGAANLSLDKELDHSSTILPISVDEVPEEYALLVNDPIMHAYKYVAAPHVATVAVKSFETQQLLTQVADHTTLNTVISQDGEAVTLAVYYVKNTDRQYLPMRLPVGASLWSVNVEGSKVQVLDRGDGQILIPVERRRDPNSPLKVEVKYAQQLDKPGMRTRMTFESPDVDTPAVFARWSFDLPSGKRLVAADGNMESPDLLPSRRANWGVVWAQLRSGMIFAWLAAAVVLVGGLFVLGRKFGSEKRGPFGFSVALVCSVISAVVLGLLALKTAVVLAGAWGGFPAEWAFSKAVSGSDGGLLVRFTMANASYGWMKTLLLAAVGLLPLAWVVVSRHWKFLFPALALLAGVFAFSPALAWTTVVLPLLLAFVISYRRGYMKGCEQRLIERSRKSLREKAGFADCRLMGLMAAAMLIAASCAAMGQLPEESSVPQAESAELQITVPDFETESRVNVTVSMQLKLKAEKGDVFPLLGPEFILKDYELSSKHLTVEAGELGTLLRVERDGTYDVSAEYLVPSVEVQGEWSAKLWVPDALKNSAVVQLPVEGWMVTSKDAVRVQQDGTAAVVLFAPSAQLCELCWVPEERKTDLEASRFFCDVNTLADFRPGMVGLMHSVQFNIAQGELRELQFDVPVGMSITEVRGEHIGTWRFDPETGLLDVVLSVPATGTYQMMVGAQVARRKLPYEAEVKGITVRGAAMQRGIVAFASSVDVQIDLLDADGLSGINIDDAARVLAGVDKAAMKRAFRYNSMPYAARVAADQVLPELRLEEVSSLDISSEQLRLSSSLNVTVSKSGIFALCIQIPEGFDVDSLSGEAVSHWDEVIGGTRELVINFSRQVIGTTSMELTLSRSGRDLEPAFSVPRIRIDDVLKHTGTMAVTVERGIRVTPVTRDGVSELSPRELGIRQDGSLAYRLLRPDWTVELQSEVMEPKLSAEVLQRVALSEGLLKVHCYVQYDIEHAGVKAFRLQPPRPDLALVVSGRNISRVRKVDDEQGIWEVELHGKVEDQYGLEVSYQAPFEHNESALTIEPLRTLGTESQKGYVAVFPGGRLQIQPTAVPEFLRPEDARSIPRRFGAGDLSDAVLCYRTTEADYDLTLNVVRHDAADVLPAQVQSVRLESVITKENQSLNQMTMQLDPGSLRFLETRLPEGAEIWSVFVNETAVRPLVEDGLYMIPIEAGADRTATVELIYQQAAKKGLLGNKHLFAGPRFQLPLSDVVWTVYAPAGYRYDRFGGTMNYQRSEGKWSRLGSFSEKRYAEVNMDLSESFGASAQDNIVKGNEYMESGDSLNARKAFQKAISYSQGQQALNEDARVQFRNLVRRQGIVGLANRRNQLRLSLNQAEGDALSGNEQWSGADVQKLEEQLGQKESSSLSALAETMLDQQQAASVEVHPIRVVMAKQGAEIQFKRALQLTEDAEMTVRFHSSKPGRSRGVQVIAIILSAGAVLLLGRLFTGMSQRAS